MKISKVYRGHIEGKEIMEYLIHTDSGHQIGVLNYGVTLTQWRLKKNDDKKINIIKSHKDYKVYLEDPDYFGAIVGRYAGRIGNGSFESEGIRYELDKNEGLTTLHGGSKGLSRQIWDLEVVLSSEDAHLIFSYDSYEGDCGFPGQLDCKTHLYVYENGSIKIRYEAKSTHLTPVSFTHHMYFNLSGADDEVLNHSLKIYSEEYMCLNSKNVATGQHSRVPEFNASVKSLGLALNQGAGLGIDHPFKKQSEGFSKIAQLKENLNGLGLNIYSNAPYFVIYSGEFLKDPFTGICFETQELPNGPNLSSFGEHFLKPGDTYERETLFEPFFY